jgi:hypothetical protein
MITLALPNPLATKTTTLMAMSVSTAGVGLVEPTMPVRLRLKVTRCVGAFLAPWRTHSGHCHPTAAWIMQSVQMGLSQRAQITEARRPAWR